MSKFSLPMDLGLVMIVRVRVVMVIGLKNTKS